MHDMVMGLSVLQVVKALWALHYFPNCIESISSFVPWLLKLDWGFLMNLLGRYIHSSPPYPLHLQQSGPNGRLAEE